MPIDQIADLQRRLWRLVARAQGMGEVPLTGAAREYWTGVYPELAKDNTGKIGPVVNRAEAQTMRLALAYALLDGKRSIDTPRIISALSLWRYAEASAKCLFHERANEPTEQKILAILKTGPCTATELGAALSRHVTRDKMRSVLGSLEAANRIDIREERTAGRRCKNITLRGFAD